LDWNRTIENFVEFGWIRTINLFKLYGQDRIWTEFKGKETGHFCCEKAAFFTFFGLHLDFTFEKSFGLWLDFELSFKKSGLDLDRKV